MIKFDACYIGDMGACGSFTCRDKPFETAWEELLWGINRMRDHDGLKRIESVEKLKQVLSCKISNI